jgi:hypothetical protein
VADALAMLALGVGLVAFAAVVGIAGAVLLDRWG